jgi:asparagine synthase (glutamine-hydrolysing)
VPAAPVTPDEGRVVEMLAGSPTSVGDSLYREIKRLPPGHLLIAAPGGIRIERFTIIDGTRRLAPRPPAVFGEEFCALMDSAVRARLRVSTGAGMMLSGGLDSTSVYSTIRTIAPDADVPAFTIAHRSPSDETPVARITVGHHRGRAVSVPEGFGSFDQIDAARRLLEVPIYPGGTNSSALRRHAAQEGRRVLLSGNGGDEWYTGSHWAAADLLRRGRLGAVIRLWRARLTAVDPPSVKHLAQSTFVPLVPRPVRRLMRRFRARAGAPPWLRSDAIARVSLHDRLRVRPEVQVDGAARRAMLIEGLHGLNVYAFEDNDRVSALCGTEERMPYYDRRLVEFALAVPDHLLAAQPTKKQFVRDAMAARLPPLFHSMRPCLDYEFINREGLERLGGRALFDTLALADAGLVDARIAREAADACWAGRSCFGIRPEDLSWPLWSLAAVEVWWRTAIGGHQTA